MNLICLAELHVLRLLHEDPVRVREERALVEENRAVLLEFVDQRDVLAVE